MTTRRTRPLAAAAAAALLVTLTPAVAHAEFIRTGDPRGDSGGARNDITQLNLINRPQQVVLNVRGSRIDSVSYYLDTKPRRKGHEFEVWVEDESYHSGFVFGPQGKQRCTGIEVFHPEGPGRARVEVPRRCLAIDGVKPRGIRTRAQASDYSFDTEDWAPRKRGWSRWASVG